VAGRYAARTLRNSFLEHWRGRDAELEADEGAKTAFREGVDRGDMGVVPVWASEAIDLITEVMPASHLVGLLAAGAEEALTRAFRAVAPSS
jgi:nitronate monooxygenase